jgi:hypothetical protein
MENIDDFIRQAEEDERADATKLPVIQYAKMRGMYPQKVYAVIRKGKILERWCECGRKVVIIDEADKYFGLGVHRADQPHGEEADASTDAGDGGELHDSAPEGA